MTLTIASLEEHERAVVLEALARLTAAAPYEKEDHQLVASACTTAAQKLGGLQDFMHMVKEFTEDIRVRASEYNDDF